MNERFFTTHKETERDEEEKLHLRISLVSFACNKLRFQEPKLGKNKGPSMEDAEQAKRLFVSGDRSSVGKSTVCLGGLGALIESGLYQPAELAYIKPATQCEDVQLVTKYCEAHGKLRFWLNENNFYCPKGIAHRGVGPLVFYTGFTREVIRGECELSAEQMLEKIEDAVCAIARGKKVSF